MQFALLNALGDNLERFNSKIRSGRRFAVESGR